MLRAYNNPISQSVDGTGRPTRPTPCLHHISVLCAVDSVVYINNTKPQNLQDIPPLLPPRVTCATVPYIYGTIRIRGENVFAAEFCENSVPGNKQFFSETYFFSNQATSLKFQTVIIIFSAHIISSDYEAFLMCFNHELKYF